MQELEKSTDVSKYKPKYVTVIRNAGVFGLNDLGCTIRMCRDEVHKTILDDIPSGAKIGLHRGDEKSFGFLSNRFRVSYKNEVKKCKQYNNTQK